GGGPGAKAPMVNVRPLGGVALDHPAAANPVADAPGLGGCGKSVIDGLIVEERPAVIMERAVEVDGAKPAGLRIPEAAGAVFANLAGVLAEVSGIESVRSGGNPPLRVRADLLLELGKIAQGVVVIDGSQGVFAAEGKQIPIIAADAFAFDDLFFAIS